MSELLNELRDLRKSRRDDCYKSFLEELRLRIKRDPTQLKYITRTGYSHNMDEEIVTRLNQEGLTTSLWDGNLSVTIPNN